MMTLIALLFMNFSMLFTASDVTVVPQEDDAISRTTITDDGGAGTWMEENAPTPGS